MKILVSGGAGFIGSHLVERLIEEKHDVVVVDDLSNGHLKNLQSLLTKEEMDARLKYFFAEKASLHLYRWDISKPLELCPNYSEDDKYDVIYHLACFPRSLSFENPQRDVEVNVIGSINLLQLAQRDGAKFIFASNSGIYDATGEMPISESTPDAPKTPYDLDKRHTEYFMRLWKENFNVPIVDNRFATVYGDRQRCNVPWRWFPVIPSFIDDLLTGKTPTIYWHGNQSRDMIFVDDLVEALVREAEVGVESPYPMLLGTGVEVSVNQIYDLINKHLVAAGLLKERVEPLRGPKARGDIEKMRYDCMKARALLHGWDPKVCLYEGIGKVVSWYRRREKKWSPDIAYEGGY